jgi:ATP-binding cassette subfamily C (CFTR/MRP) protein 1
MAFATFASVLGAIILVTIINQYFLIFLIAIVMLYLLAAVFYAKSARELKGIDNLLRSGLYGFVSHRYTLHLF